MSRVGKLLVHDQEICTVDYRDLKEAEMIKAASELRQLIAQDNKPVVVLTIFNDKAYVTPAFMRHAEKETAEVLHLLDRVAFLGLSPTKKIILNGYNLLFRRNFRAFATREEAIDYLLHHKGKE